MRFTYHQLVGMTVRDVNGKKVGRVADIAAERDGDALRVTGLYVGPSALLRRIGSHRNSILEEKPAEQVPWGLIARIDDQIHLRIANDELVRVAPGVAEPEAALRPGGEQ